MELWRYEQEEEEEEQGLIGECAFPYWYTPLPVHTHTVYSYREGCARKRSRCSSGGAGACVGRHHQRSHDETHARVSRAFPVVADTSPCKIRRAYAIVWRTRRLCVSMLEPPVRYAVSI
jgi:hypothetical protein